MSFFVGPLILLFWTSDDFCPGLRELRMMCQQCQAALDDGSGILIQVKLQLVFGKILHWTKLS